MDSGAKWREEASIGRETETKADLRGPLTAAATSSAEGSGIEVIWAIIRVSLEGDASYNLQMLKFDRVT